MDEVGTIINGIKMVQKRKASGLTFGELAKELFVTSLAIGSNSSRNDVVFDQYKCNSVTGVEHSQRAVGSLVFRLVFTSQSIQHWRAFLSSWNNKKELITFTIDRWRSDTMREQTVSSKKIYVAASEECCYLSKPNAEIVHNFHSNQ